MRSASAQGNLVEELVIDLASEPDSFDPALTYKIDGWSVVHSVYDSLYQYGPEGALEPLLAQSAPALIDPLTYEIKLRPGVTFHNGEPVDAKSVAFSVAHIVDEKTGSQIAGQFKVISEVKEPVPVSGSAWVRIATDVAPFSDVRVRQALNYAVDVDAIRDALYGGYGQRLPNFFAPGGLGFDPALAPYSYDPERARALLSEAGYPDGFETTLAHTIGDRPDLPEAIAGQLAEVGIKVTTQPQEDAAFNAAWKDPNAAPLRLATWRPLFDPYTLLSLVVSSKGFLSRYDSPTVQPLIDAFATETDLAKRAEVGRQLGKALYEDPAAIYLFNLTSLYGVADDVTAWTPRADDYIIATARG
jgi:ABC-type transport system substrate-binding protein